MKIKIVGPEKDPVFQDIQHHFLQAIHELQIDATIDEVTQLSEMQNYPLLVYPAIFINDELCCQGHDISLEKAKQCLLEALEKEKK